MNSATTKSDTRQLHHMPADPLQTITEEPGPEPTTAPDREAKPGTTLSLRDLQIFYGDFQAVADVTMEIQPNAATAFIGSSGCGKSTVLRAINRMHELTSTARVEGEVVLDGQNIYAPGVDPVAVRTKVGMVFQQPQPVPDDVGVRQRRGGLPSQQPQGQEGRSGRRRRGGAAWREPLE